MAHKSKPHHSAQFVQPPSEHLTLGLKKTTCVPSTNKHYHALLAQQDVQRSDWPVHPNRLAFQSYPYPAKSTFCGQWGDHVHHIHYRAVFGPVLPTVRVHVVSTEYCPKSWHLDTNFQLQLVHSNRNVLPNPPIYWRIELL